jgi:glycosyltransferase involved in cell wall biosynthesis
VSFSVLMSVYHKEKSEYFNRAMVSIWDEQIIKPDEIVLVQDGRLTEELYKSINSWQEKLGDVFKTIKLDKNIGLGGALNIGIKACSFELIARMDTDDICMKNRFKKQLQVFENIDIDIDICSSWVSEFDNDENKIVSYRKLPEFHNEIIKLSKKRCPINHPAVMYKKSIVDKAGGYKKMLLLEDYYLWGRMILNGAKFYNIQESLVNMRAGYGQLERRGGMNYFISEYRLHKKFLDIKFINYMEFIQNISIRFLIRMLPKAFLKIIYQSIRKK